MTQQQGDDGSATEFRLALSEKELTALGRFYVVWSQIDFLLACVISRIMNVEHGIGSAFMDTMTTGARLAMLRRNLDNIADPEIREDARRFCNGLAALVDQRNHITHGMWGTYVNPATKAEYSAAYFGTKGFKPLYASELAELALRAGRKTRELGKILNRLNPGYTLTPEKPFWFSEEPEEMTDVTII